ncbi:MAG: UDP-N-acetylmuramate dehydrogenase, partial [Candidatus Competibacteraceae bacterium]|nr:UDP-N-acetylmuramate dehydrogenase [Candidatus Competibacteraceae bacterium]
ARYTTWRVGGPADRLYLPADLGDLQAFLARLPMGEPLLFIGLGSNLLVRDGGVRGTVVALRNTLTRMERVGERQLAVEAGAPCARVARFAARHDLVGGEFLAGIPGALGGALAMNAGAWGGETWARVAEVSTIDHRGRIRQRSGTDYRVGYRRVEGPQGEWFVAARLELEPGDGAVSLTRIKELLERRSATQPMGAASCGSVFRNPPGDHAARLIETAGLKGTCRGGARVADKHANFIVNAGGATARDLEALIDQVRETVQRVHGVALIPEVRVIGEAI